MCICQEAEHGTEAVAAAMQGKRHTYTKKRRHGWALTKPLIAITPPAPLLSKNEIMV